MTAPDGRMVYINPEQVCSVARDPLQGGLTQVKLTCGTQSVTQGQEWVAAALVGRGVPTGA